MRPSPPAALQGATGAPSLRVVPPQEDFEGEAPREHRYDHRQPESRSSSWAALVLVIIILGAALAYVMASPGWIDRLLPEIAQPQAPVAPPPAIDHAGPSAAPQATRAAPPVVDTRSDRPPVPDMAGLGILIRNTIAALGHANATGNYSVLREIASPRFQEANTPARLSEAFADLRSRNLDLGLATAVPPSLHRDPLVNEQGMLNLAGSFPAASGPVAFELVFEMVETRWRLFGIAVQPSGTAEPKPAPADASKLPDPTAMIALIRSHIIALNQANLTGNYSVLRDMAAPGFQQNNSFAELTEIFAALRARQLDFGPVAVLEPKLYKPPAIDPTGMLRLTGFFPSQPERVNFDLAFQNVGGEWRLFGIGVNTSREVAATEPGTAGPATPPSPGSVSPPKPPARPAP